MTGAFYMDSVDIAGFGAAGILGSEAYPLTGVFDLPQREGNTEYNWGTGIEAFVHAEDIELGGRTLTLTVLVKGTTHAEYLERLEGFKNASIQCKVLGTPFGHFNVIQRDDISVSGFHGQAAAAVTVSFFEEIVALPPFTVTPSGGTGILLDGFNLQKDLGIGVSEIKDSRNTGKRIEVGTTATYKRTGYRDKPTVTLSCFLVGKNLMDLYGKVGQLSALCVKPGLRVLRLEDGTLLSVYIKDGITVRIEDETVLAFDLKLRVV